MEETRTRDYATSRADAATAAMQVAMLALCVLFWAAVGWAAFEVLG